MNDYSVAPQEILSKRSREKWLCVFTVPVAAPAFCTGPSETRWCHFMSILPVFSQLADLSSSLFFLIGHHSGTLAAHSVVSDWELAWLRRAYFFKLGTGHSWGISTSYLCLSVCKNILNPRMRCLCGNECKQTVAGLL